MEPLRCSSTWIVRCREHLAGRPNSLDALSKGCTRVVGPSPQASVLQDSSGLGCAAALEKSQFGPPDAHHSDFSGSRVWHAADAVDDLREEWQREWSM
jgi:hypothetical protein